MDGQKNFSWLVAQVVDFIDLLIVFLFALTFIVVLWKVMDTWIMNAGDEEKIAEGKKTITIAIIGFVVMAGIWSIIYIVRSSFFGS